jgi:F-type H+-transporting ATPase subunit b
MASKRQWMKMLLAVVLFAVMIPGRPAVAQDRPETDPKAEKAVNKAIDQADKAEGKREEKEGGAADAIRHSPAIKLISRHTGLTDDQAYWLCIGLNFGVIFVAMAWLLRKNLPVYFRGRTSTIQKGIEEARQASEEARQRLSDVEGRLSRLDSEIAGMKREADENGKAEEQRIQAAGEEERRRIVASAEQEIEMTANAARRELKSYVSELAIELAEKKIRVSKDTDEALVRAFTTQMGKDGN